MIGIGIDIIGIERFQQSISRFGDRLLRKLFTDDEIRFCTTQPNPASHFASRFAAKEALSKALATGKPGDFEWKNVEVIRRSIGNPYFKFYNKTADRLTENTVILTLSYSDTDVVALVIIQKKFKKDSIFHGVS